MKRRAGSAADTAAKRARSAQDAALAGSFAGLGTATAAAQNAQPAAAAAAAAAAKKSRRKRADETDTLEKGYQGQLYSEAVATPAQDRLLVKDLAAERWLKNVGAKDNNNENDGMNNNETDSGGRDGEPALEPTNRPAKPALTPKQQLVQAKEKLAKTAALINEDPESNIGGLRDLQELAESPLGAIQRIALATQLAVYKDIIPGYRIRPLTEADTAGKVSKEIRKLREYEQRLVAGYKAYVDTLTALTRSAADGERRQSQSQPQSQPQGREREREREQAATTSLVAVTCACALVTEVPHFNFRSDLLAILVRKVSVRERTEEMSRCVAALERLFREDEDGYASTEAVGLLARMIKARDLSVHESVLNVFLQLRLLDEFVHKASAAAVDGDDDDDEDKSEAAGAGAAGQRKQKLRGRKVKREQAAFQTKRDRKAAKERRKLEAELADADAAVSHVDRDRLQGDALKLVFGVYFRVLKARVRHLTGAVLEGLARYAHLINQDFFGDIIEALRELVGEREAEAAAAAAGEGADDDADDSDDDSDDDAGQSGTRASAARESLLCAITAFALLDGQQAAATVARASAGLGLDLSFFVTQLYRALFPLSLDPDIDLAYARADGAAAAHLLDQQQQQQQQRPAAAAAAGAGAGRRQVNFQTTVVLLIRSLSAALLPAHQPARSVPAGRVAAFLKRLSTAATALPERPALAVLGLVTQVVRAHGGRVAALWFSEERRGDGVHAAAGTEVEASNPFAATVWEGEVWRIHYCPAIRTAGKEIEKAVIAATK